MKRPGNTGFSILALAVIAIPLTALVGLAIDTSVLYLIKGRLSAAVDAGALAGARGLSRGSAQATQENEARAVAVAYVRANYPESFMMSRNLNVPAPVVNTTVANQRSVSVSANVQAPSLFLSVIGVGPTTVRAEATAIRRDVNIMLVLDRSTSLADSGSCDDVREAASSFVAQFSNGRDYLGLVTFATSSYVEFPMATNFVTASPNVNTIISRINCSGFTSSADGITTGYHELARLGAPNALNVIVFFTDGQPTAVHGDFQRKTGSFCSNPTIRGVWAAGPYQGSHFRNGLFKASGVGPSPTPGGDRVVAPNSSGCYYAIGWETNSDDPRDFQYVPDTDIWGNRIRTGYRTIPNTSSGKIDYTRWENGEPAASNALDDAASRIRAGATISGRSLSNVIIFGIGLGNTPNAADNALMLRVTNDPGSPIFNTAQREGLYIFAPDAADLNNAFTRIASEVLRLSQ